MTTHSFLSGALLHSVSHQGFGEDPQDGRSPPHSSDFPNLAPSNSEIPDPPYSSCTSPRRSTMIDSIAASFLTHPLPPELAASACRQGEEPTWEYKEDIEE